MTDTWTDDELGASIDSWDGSDEGFTVNISEKEASAEAFENEILPAGWYHVAVTEVTLEESKSAKNPGKPMFNVQLTVQGGDFNGRKMYDRWCLWTGALYSVSMAMKAVGLNVNEGELRIPPARWWLGKEMLLQIKLGNKMRKNETTGAYDIPDVDEHGRPIKESKTGGYKMITDDWSDDKMPKKAKGKAGTSSSAASAGADSLAP